MERNRFSNSFLKHNEASIEDNDNNNQNNYKLKEDSSSSSRRCNNQGFGDDYLAGFSWPPRSYTCSFCKREFRSAQALGGHMNVHRRDRARLRQSPPEDFHLHVHGGHGHGHPSFLNLNLIPNPNPNFSSSNSSTFPSPFSSPKWRVNGTLIDPLMTSKAASDSTNMLKLGVAKSGFGVKELKDYDMFMGKKIDYVTLDLDLEIGLVGDHSKEDLDLELRLGYS